MSLPLVVRHYFWWTEEISNNQKVVSNHDFTKSCCMKCNKNLVLIKCYTWEWYKSKLLNSLQLWNQNGNFRKLEFIGRLSDQQRQLLCRTDTVFASLGLRSSGLFRRLTSCLACMDSSYFDFIFKKQHSEWLTLLYLITVVCFFCFHKTSSCCLVSCMDNDGGKSIKKLPPKLHRRRLSKGPVPPGLCLKLTHWMARTL